MNVTKSRYDLRDYKVINLANGITALLISDLRDKTAADDDELDGDAASESSSNTDTPSNCNQSAAALCVGVGSFSDPKDVQGLAHFLEHMVFMGSSKYPEENGFDAFVSKHGGYSNACTDCERTMFKFSIPPKYFREGLDIFCHFFVSPLLAQTSVDREVEAVDSEFHLASQVDSCRIQQLRNHIAVDGHPMSKFLWGNSVSLKKNPTEEGINIHERVKEFYSKYYSSSYMTLAVMSRDTLDDLERWVTDSFSNVPNNNQPCPTFCDYPKPYDESFNRLYKVVPIKDTHQLHIMWCLPPSLDLYRVKPLHYLGWLVGHEGTGSIMSLLKKKHYAVSLEAGNGCQGYEMNTNFSLFQCSITLTDKGYNNIVECCSIVFQYIKMLQQVGVVERVFKEMQSLEDISFTFREAEEPIEYVEWISEAMQLYPREQYLTGRFLMFNYQPEVIQNIQNMLVPEAANIVFMSPRVSGECSFQEPWFGTSYNVEDVPSEWIEQWKSLPLHPQLHIPSVNPFIATEFKLKDVDQYTSQYPQAIKDTPCYKLWYRQDDVFKLFRARIHVHFISLYPSCSAERAVMTDLMIELLLHNVAEIGYQAEIAQLSYSLVAERSGIVMKLSGFDHKISLLYETLVDHMGSFQTREEDFMTFKSELKKNYHNSVIKAKKLSKQMRLKVIEEVFWSTVDKLDVIDHISLANFMDFVQLFKSQLYVEALVQGNVTSQEAIRLMEYLCSHMKYQPLSSDVQPQFRTMELPCNQVLLWQQSGLNQQSPNTAIVNYYQCCQSDIYSHTLTQLLIQCMSEPCFDVLRTKNQLGYDVHCSTHMTNGIVGFSLAVVTQATKFSVHEASQCMQQFVHDFYGFLTDLSNEDFEDHVKALIDVIMEVDTSLEQEVSRNWSEIMKQFYVFDRRHKEVAILQNVTQQDLIGWFKKHTRIGADLRLLRIQITGHGDKEHDNSDQSDDSTDYAGEVTYINNIDKFKQSINVLPVTMVTS